MKKISIFIILLILFTGCATSNKPNHYGNYNVSQIDDKNFEILFHGNGNQTMYKVGNYPYKPMMWFHGNDIERNIDYTMLRSAEVVLEKGFSYFSIIDSETDERTMFLNVPAQEGDSYRYNSLGNVILIPEQFRNTISGQFIEYSFPQVKLKILCYKEKPKDAEYYNAEAIVGSLKQKYKIN